ncbi:retron St85 family RNA-directed DNA polymerase [Rhizobium tubonense]|uniref:RNA-directed DNA polymerase n=1 Tax=Rhizobium tubonense TaxID=484088 RepID=A0A2W4D6S6_9HYPH|nr:retron St85 family RNA-directed DNA polymerase [Rhizobium tubonense]PZM13034.1 hypothetical protein CPY51_16085 [Rhizobium tubonense]
MTLFDELSILTGLGASDLNRLIYNAPARYKEFPIKKRSGEDRIIAQPSRELKIVQRYIAGLVLNRLPIHSAATAYKEGANIFANVQSHSANRIILKLDFTDFFHSIKPTDWRNYAKVHIPSLSKEDVELSAKVLFWGMKSNRPICLSIGAPTSPVMSNLIMYDLDEQFFQITNDIGVTYTRYADDITLSGSNKESVIEAEKAIRVAVRKCKSPKLLFNESKRGIYSTGQRRHITGLNITPSGKISLGRERKRMISSLIHKYSLMLLDANDVGKLKGYLAFSLACEPEFLGRMRIKYGSTLIEEIQKTHIPARTLPES